MLRSWLQGGNLHAVVMKICREPYAQLPNQWSNELVELVGAMLLVSVSYSLVHQLYVELQCVLQLLCVEGSSGTALGG